MHDSTSDAQAKPSNAPSPVTKLSVKAEPMANILNAYNVYAPELDAILSATL